MEKMIPTQQVERRGQDAAGWWTVQTHIEHLPAVYHCRRLERTRGTPYPEIVRRVVTMLAEPPLKNHAMLVLDDGGPGRPVFDLLRAAGIEPLIPLSIHGGSRVTYDGDFGVPKRDLIGVAQVMLQSGRLKIAAELPLRETLVKELENYRMTISAATGHDSYDARADSEHDDLVLACCISLWYAERWKPPQIVRSVSMRTWS